MLRTGNEARMIDLHVHSICSDGSLTPEALVVRATEIGLTAMALTDHDTLAGVETFCQATRATNGALEGIPGVEMSADWPEGTLHVLAYFFEGFGEGLEGVLERMRDGRGGRNREILKRLQALGMDLTWDDVEAQAAGGVVGRPHFAKIMVDRGYVSDMREAFDSYLAKGSEAYVDRFRLAPRDCVREIHDAGGVAVLAHPFTLGMTPEAMEAFLSEMVEAGLDGVEVYYPEHSEDQVKTFRALAEQFHLVSIGGTDFHGELTPNLQLGIGFGSLEVPESCLEDLRHRWQRQR